MTQVQLEGRPTVSSSRDLLQQVGHAFFTEAPHLIILMRHQASAAFKAYFLVRSMDLNACFLWPWLLVTCNVLEASMVVFLPSELTELFFSHFTTSRLCPTLTFPERPVFCIQARLFQKPR